MIVIYLWREYFCFSVKYIRNKLFLCEVIDIWVFILKGYILVVYKGF